MDSSLTAVNCYTKRVTLRFLCNPFDPSPGKGQPGDLTLGVELLLNFVAAQGHGVAENPVNNAEE